MKASTMLVTLSLALYAAAIPQQRKGSRVGGFKGNGAKAAQGAAIGGAVAAGTAASGAAAGAVGSKNATASSVVASAASTAAAAAASTAAVDNASNNTAVGGAAVATGDPQTSLTLDPKVIASGFADDGQDVPAAGQVASLTSTNNFINFCLTVPNLPITNGKQIQTGSCNPAPIGVIPSVDNMPSAKFVFPPNGDDSLVENEPFTITMAVSKLDTGNFVNAQENYFAAPQQVNAQGQIIGHTHVVIEALDSLGQITPTNPRLFAFFKGVNGAAVNGLVTVEVDAGVPAGAYRLASINTAANHQPAIVPIAQHGSLDDLVYFTVNKPGQIAAGAADNAGAAAAQPAAATVAAAPSVAAAADASASAVSAAPAAPAPAPAAATAAVDTSNAAAAGVAAAGAPVAPVAAAATVPTPASAIAATAKGGFKKRMLKSRLELEV